MDDITFTSCGFRLVPDDAKNAGVEMDGDNPKEGVIIATYDINTDGYNCRYIKDPDDKWLKYTPPESRSLRIFRAKDNG